MTAPMTGPAWYWWAGTIALILWAWAAFGLLAGPPLGRWLRRTAAEQTTELPARETPRPRRATTRPSPKGSTSTPAAACGPGPATPGGNGSTTAASLRPLTKS